ncbi:MAG: prolipoprotein diacylglyceryl transferase [Clostridia bacterium]|nr:prolipoprotein diacylglyceryl transferase [Clostridia bacterium]
MIDFPGLGLHFNINPVALQIGNIRIFWYGIIIAIGFMLAVFLSMKNSQKYGIDQENIIDLVLVAAPVAIIFARLYYVVFQWENYRNDLSEIYKIWHGGIAIYGAIIGALLAAYLFARYKKISTLDLFDLCSPYLILAQGIGRWGNFVNQEAFGVNTTLPWGMTSEKIKDDLLDLQRSGMNVDPNLPVHPTFLYESLWNLASFLVLIWFRKHRKVKGEVFFLYMILYGLGRFWVEGLRTDSLMLGNVRVSQLLALVFAIAFCIVFFLRRKGAVDSKTEDETVIGTSAYGDVLRKLNEEQETIEPGTKDTSSDTANQGVTKAAESDDESVQHKQDE